MQVNIVFMVVALATVFKTKRRSVKRRKSMKNTENGDKARFGLFKYNILCVHKSIVHNIIARCSALLTGFVT